MPTTVITTGVDTYVSSVYPKRNYAGAAYPTVVQQAGQPSAERVLVQLPGIPVGAAVLSATLTCPLRGAIPAGLGPQLRATAIGESWSVSKVTYASLPALIGSPSPTITLPAMADGDLVTFDVTALVAAIAAGQPNYGWLIDGPLSSPVIKVPFYGFDSGHDSWMLTVETSDQPIAPAQLTPQGVISLGKWACQIDDQDDLTQIRVQVDPSANATSPAFDSGWVPVTSPVLDLATTSYAGLADGASTYWRAAVKTSTGVASDFSEWAQVTRHVKPSLVMDSPPATLVYDSTPTIEAHLSPAGTATTRWQVKLLDATNGADVRYDSGGDITGATLSHTIPHSYRNKVVMPKDGTYRLQVKCWDRSDRVGSYGDPPYLLVDEIITLDVDGTVATPSGLVASQPLVGGPDVLLHWTATADPDYFTISRDGEKIPFEIDPDDARIAPGVFEWVDATAEPNTEHRWRVRAHVGSKRSAESVSATLTPDVRGVWLRSNYGTVTLSGPSSDDGGMSDAAQTDKRTTYALPYAFEDVDIIGAVSGLSGTLNLTIDNRTLGSWSQDVTAAAAILEKVRQHSAVPVRLVWGTTSIPAYLRGLSVAPADSSSKRVQIRKVTGSFFQTDDVQQAGFGVGYYGAGTYY